jgi:putative sporulation protein YyaC
LAAHEDVFKGVTIGRYTSSDKLAKDLNKYINVTNDDVIFFCVGTDRSTGDSLAPLIGTYLKEQGYSNVMGTIDDPIHAMNLDEYIAKIPDGKTVIAIDAALGRMKSIGTFSLSKGELKAGQGVGKNLTSVGDYHISGVVNISHVDSHLSFLTLQNTRLNTVVNMAKEVTEGLFQAYPLQATNNERKLNII